MPNLGPNDEIQISGLGIFQNGKSYSISDVAELNFRNAHASMSDIDGAPATQPGASLVDAAETMHGITVAELDDTAAPQHASATEGAEGGQS
jgi:hypothetical protein